jgi:hypothetical protein
VRILVGRRIAWLTMVCAVLAACGGSDSDNGARNKPPDNKNPMSGSGGMTASGSGGMSGGGDGGGAAGTMNNGGGGGHVSDPMNGGSGMGGMGSGGTGADAGSGGNDFDAGSADDRNAVTPGKICDRLATILCASEAACCDKPGRDVAACKTAINKSCTDDAMFDSIAGQKAAGFDAAQAKVVFTEIERLASTCDLSINEYSAGKDGLRTIFKGTIAPGADCTPVNAADKAMAGGALASCTMNDDYACLPGVPPLPWKCSDRGASGDRCFSDVNCKDDLFCDNPDLTVNITSKCMARKAEGASCKTVNECTTLLCKGGKCVAKAQQNAYCLGN